MPERLLGVTAFSQLAVSKELRGSWLLRLSSPGWLITAAIVSTCTGRYSRRATIFGGRGRCLSEPISKPTELPQHVGACMSVDACAPGSQDQPGLGWSSLQHATCSARSCTAYTSLRHLEVEKASQTLLSLSQRRSHLCASGRHCCLRIPSSIPQGVDAVAAMTPLLLLLNPKLSCCRPARS